MTNDQFVALLASIGACLSAVATFLTVRQIAKQREASYRPELALSRVYLECTKDPITQGSIPTLWAAKGKDGKTDPLTRSLSLLLRNVGLGTAKGVSIEPLAKLPTAKCCAAALASLKPVFDVET